MINPTGKKLEKLLFGIFDDAIEGIDRYNHNGSLWLIFTDEMRWVVEYTKEQTLWYNFNFFKNEMELVGLDCVENKDLIQKWFESRFLNIEPVEYARAESFHFNRQVEDTIQNGVKHTWYPLQEPNLAVEDTIQNGVKLTKSTIMSQDSKIEDTIQNGVKDTKFRRNQIQFFVEDTIQNGVKYSFPFVGKPFDEVNGIIQNGVKEIMKSDFYRISRIKDVTQNGVKHCEDGDWLNGDERFEDIIQNGVKEMQPLPAQDGNRDWGLYYQRQEDRTKPHAEYVREVIEEYHHRRREVVITMNDGVKEIHDDCSNNIGRVGGVIRIGEKLN